jgi:hypothetical protein
MNQRSGNVSRRRGLRIRWPNAFRDTPEPGVPDPSLETPMPIEVTATATVAGRTPRLAALVRAADAKLAAASRPAPREHDAEETHPGPSAADAEGPDTAPDLRLDGLARPVGPTPITDTALTRFAQALAHLPMSAQEAAPAPAVQNVTVVPEVPDVPETPDVPEAPDVPGPLEATLEHALEALSGVDGAFTVEEATADLEVEGLAVRGGPHDELTRKVSAEALQALRDLTLPAPDEPEATRLDPWGDATVVLQAAGPAPLTRPAQNRLESLVTLAIASLDDPDTASDDLDVCDAGGFVLALEKRLIRLPWPDDWEPDHAGVDDTLCISVHRVPPDLLLGLDEGVLTSLLKSLHSPEHSLLVAWLTAADYEASHDTGLLCEPAPATVALLLRMRLQSRDAFLKALLACPLGAARRALGALSDMALPPSESLQLGLQAVHAALSPTAPLERDEAAILDTASCALERWLAHPAPTLPGFDVEIPAAPWLDRDMRDGASVGILLAAASHYFETQRSSPRSLARAREHVRQRWRVWQHALRLDWLPAPVLQLLDWALEALGDPRLTAAQVGNVEQTLAIKLARYSASHGAASAGLDVFARWLLMGLRAGRAPLDEGPGAATPPH